MFSKPDADTTLVFLIRHGATAANMQRPYILQGRGLNGPLNENGIAQVSQARDYLQHEPIDAFYASPMVRATQSAQIIAEPHQLEVQPISEIEEVDVGDWEGKAWQTIMQEDPEEYEQFIANPADIPYKNGESYRDVQSRIVPAITQAAADNMGKIITIVAHNVVNRTLLAALMGIDLKKAKDIKQANACVNVLKYHEGKLEVVTVNGIFHLQ